MYSTSTANITQIAEAIALVQSEDKGVAKIRNLIYKKRRKIILLIKSSIETAQKLPYVHDSDEESFLDVISNVRRKITYPVVYETPIF